MARYHFSHLEEYTTFNSIEELNHHVNRFRDKTSETEFKVLWFISKYAIKYIGAAHLKLETIADGISMSVKTVQRAIKSLIGLKAIEKINTTKPIKGGRGANIYQIQPSYDLDVQAQMSKRDNVEKARQDSVRADNSENQSALSLSKKSLKEFNTYTAPVTEEDTYYSKPYRSFIKTVGQFINDKKIASKMYGIYLAQIKHLKGSYEKETLLNLALSAIRTTFIATKSKVVKSLTGYFNGILNNKLDGLYQEVLEEMWNEDQEESKPLNSVLMFNWLEN